MDAPSGACEVRFGPFEEASPCRLGSVPSQIHCGSDRAGRALVALHWLATTPGAGEEGELQLSVGRARGGARCLRCVRDERTNERGDADGTCFPCSASPSGKSDFKINDEH